jgi:hypothetical protein
MVTTSKILQSYDVGYAAFTHAHDFVAEGIDWFERWDRMGAPRALQLPVHHAAIVVSPSTVVEAQMKAGVVERPLADYLQSKTTTIVFRRPRGWTPELGQRIAAAARSKVGCKYNTWLIAAQAMANGFVGHAINVLCNDALDRWVSARLDRKREFICSELAAWALNEQPELMGRGMLSAPLNTISPEELFLDRAVFELPTD